MFLFDFSARFPQTDAALNTKTAALTAPKVIDPQPMARTPSTPLGVGLPVSSEKFRRLRELNLRLIRTSPTPND